MTTEDMVLKAALDNDWRVKKMPETHNRVYNGWWIRRGAVEITIAFDKIDGGMMFAQTRNREFEGRNEVLEYLKGKP